MGRKKTEGKTVKERGREKETMIKEGSDREREEKQKKGRRKGTGE